MFSKNEKKNLLWSMGWVWSGRVVGGEERIQTKEILVLSFEKVRK
jgi:hypothetical protein